MLRVPSYCRSSCISVTKLIVKPAAASPLWINNLHTSSVQRLDNKSNSKEPVEEDISDVTPPETVPWYLRESEKVIAKVEPPPIPEIPQDAPVSIEKFLILLSEDYGLEDIKLFDLSSLHPDHPNHTSHQPVRYMIIATGKSEKHVYKAGNELKHYIKHQFKSQANIEGLASSTISPVVKRRMLRRPNKGPSATDNNYGRPANSWIMCKTDVDDINIHILTKQRREELDLEALWVNEYNEDLFTQELDSTDTTFIKNVHANSKLLPNYFQSKRKLHTCTRLLSTNITNDLSSIYSQLLHEDIENLSSDAVQQYTKQFDLNFTKIIEPTIDDYNLKSQFYITLHLVSPNIITIEKTKKIMQEKYNDLSLNLNTDMTNERTSDLVTFMKLLSDSPELRQSFNGKELPIQLYDTLSKFAMTIYKFTGEKIDIESRPEFIPLLLNLSSILDPSDKLYLGPSTIDSTIYNDENNYDQEFLTTTISGGAIRNVNGFLDNYLQHQSNVGKLTRSIKELVLFNYGNAGDWERFWNEWNISLHFLEEEIELNQWVRLIVYLTLRRDIVGINQFFDHYWHSSNSVSPSFLDSYISNFTQLNAQEKSHLTYCLNKLIKLPGVEVSDTVIQFVNSM